MSTGRRTDEGDYNIPFAFLKKHGDQDDGSNMKLPNCMYLSSCELRHWSVGFGSLLPSLNESEIAVVPVVINAIYPE